jgi:hypothetical protein
MRYKPTVKLRQVSPNYFGDAERASRRANEFDPHGPLPPPWRDGEVSLSQSFGPPPLTL